MDPGSRIFFNFWYFCFSWSNFRTRFWPRGHMPRGCAENEKERSWKADMFRHNRTKIEGVKALKIKIFKNTQYMIYTWKTKIMLNMLSFTANYQLIRETSGVCHFFWLSVRSFWGILSQNLMKNGQVRATIRSHFFPVQIHNPKSKFSGGQKGPLLTNSGAPNGLRWWP